jgi:uncharacterized protein (DUF2141 family)
MNRFLIIITLLMIILCFTYAEDKTNNELTVIVYGIEGLKGQIAIGLFNNQNDWIKDKQDYIALKIKVSGDTIFYTYKNIPKGIYAVALYHDENMNGILDFGLFYIPKEGYAFSNNVFGILGPPKFEKASFLLDGKKTIQIEINY